MTNRNKIKSWFVTYPQKPEKLSKEIFVETIKNLYDPNYVICCVEDHKENGEHFHLAFKCQGLSKANVLKELKSTFPESWKRIHLRAIKSWNKAILYISKEDSSPIIWGKSPLLKNPYKDVPTDLLVWVLNTLYKGETEDIPNREFFLERLGRPLPRPPTPPERPRQ